MSNTTPTRTALVLNPASTLESVQAYLPGNYNAVDVPAEGESPAGIIIVGRDVSGWTLDGYVIPRLASGLHFAQELEGQGNAFLDLYRRHQ